MTPTVRVRAAVNLAGLGYGAEAQVDPDDPYIAGLLQAGLLVRLDDPSPPPEEEPQATEDAADGQAVTM